MDSVTQLVTGAVFAAAVVPASHRRAALWAGAALGTLPDLDVLPLAWLNDDPVVQMTAHRSITHSLLILPWVAALIWWWCRRRGGEVAAAPAAWWWAIFLALVTHPLLDCFNAYGTWLFWPFGQEAVMWGNMFVIDPLFTLPLLLAFVWIAWRPQAPQSGWVAQCGIAVSVLYLAWSLLAQMWVMHKVEAQLSAMGLQDAPRLVTATPFNTLVWQVVVMTPDGVLTSDYSISQDGDETGMAFLLVDSDTALLQAQADNVSIARLTRFNQGFEIAQVQNQRLVISDVRMGSYPHYTFNFAVAQWQDGQWQALQPPEQIHYRPDVAEALAYLHQRVWGKD